MTPQSQGTFILFSDFEQLKNEVEKLRTELSMLMLERDSLVYVEAKNLEMRYMLELGAIEYRAYEAQCTVLRLKRKIELIQARKNRQEKIVLPEIDRILDQEFIEYQKALNAKIDEMNAAIERSRLPVLSQEETRELKKLYRRIVKILHPDLNPDLTEAQKELFYHAVTAYENGDLQTLQVISEMLSDPGELDCSETTMVRLAHEKERLRKLLNALQEEIAQIKSQFPFTVKELLQSPEKIAARREELNELIREYQAMISMYQAKIKEMLR